MFYHSDRKVTNTDHTRDSLGLRQKKPSWRLWCAYVSLGIIDNNSKHLWFGITVAFFLLFLFNPWTSLLKLDGFLFSIVCSLRTEKDPENEASVVITSTIEKRRESGKEVHLSSGSE